MPILIAKMAVSAIVNSQFASAHPAIMEKPADSTAPVAPWNATRNVEAVAITKATPLLVCVFWTFTREMTAALRFAVEAPSHIAIMVVHAREQVASACIPMKVRTAQKPTTAKTISVKMVLVQKPLMVQHATVMTVTLPTGIRAFATSAILVTTGTRSA